MSRTLPATSPLSPIDNVFNFSYLGFDRPSGTGLRRQAFGKP